MSAFILMYHRVCERAEARPWFARGTAVTPRTFAAQMRWLRERFDVVPLRNLLAEVGERAGCGRRRPLAALTFDDGYADIVRHALPVCRELGLVGTVFPVCDHLAGRGHTLWFDALYAVLQAACDPACADEDDPMAGGTPLSWWVRGPEKEALQLASPDERRVILREITARLDLRSEPHAELYLSEDDLASLVDQGWSVGGHGVTHSRLTSLDDLRLRDELTRSVTFACRFDAEDVVFAYPDGAHDDRVRAFAAEAGIKWGLTVSPGPVVSPDGTLDPLMVPRYFCRGGGEIPNPALAGMAKEPA